MEYEKEVSKDTIMDNIYEIKSLLAEYKDKCKDIEEFINTQNYLADEVTNLLYESLEKEIENIQEEINSLIDSINDENNSLFIRKIIKTYSNGNTNVHT